MNKIELKSENCLTILTISDDGKIDIVLLSSKIKTGVVALKTISSKSTLYSLLEQGLCPWPTKSSEIVIFQGGSLCHIDSGISVRMKDDEKIRDLLIEKVNLEFKIT